MMRTLMAADVAIAVFMFGIYIGTLFHEYSPGQRTTVIGFFGLAVYVLAGQNKAVQLHIPFDAYSWPGLASATVINIGLGWSLWERRPRKRA